MSRKFLALIILSLVISFGPITLNAIAGERNVVSLRDFRSKELRSAGLKIPKRMTVHVTATGGRSGSSWTSGDEGLFATGWLINARTRDVVWEMTTDNSRHSGEEISADEQLTLEQGEYEVYFAAPTFSYKTWKSGIDVNIDHRKKRLFDGDEEKGEKWFFEHWLSDDLAEAWETTAAKWGIDIHVRDSDAGLIGKFSPPLAIPNTVLRTTGRKDNSFVRQGFRLDAPLALNIYAIGETAGSLADGGWIVDASSGERVWEMNSGNTHHAGGAEKNVRFAGSVRLSKGEYVLVAFTDDSHSEDDWNALPPWDPYNWGITLSVQREEDKRKVELFDYQGLKNVIVKLTKAGNSEYRQEAFSLKEETQLRIYAFGERSLFTRTLADYGYIMDARTRTKVWTMDVDRCSYAGGASKNVSVEEVITLPRGSYVVVYKTDDSHAYGNWNSDPPFDKELYGISIMGASKDFNPSVVVKGGQTRDQRIIAQIVRVGDNADQSEKFKISKPLRVRVYAIGEGQKREMFDYGWIERQGSVIWEMTYGMTFHAGGGRKNRMVNTTLLLEKGEYTLRYVSDDSHSFNQWNDDPPDDQELWGITLYDEPADAPAPPPPPSPSPPGGV